jgi:hypothetical protein
VSRDQYGLWDDDVYVSGYSGTRLLEDDVVELIGTAHGLLDYETVLGATRTVPRLDAVSLRFLAHEE